jgi:adenylate cyclase
MRRLRSLIGGISAFILLALLSSVIVLTAYFFKSGFLTLLHLKATDAMFVTRGAIEPPDEIVIVAVDEKSVNELGRWPWTRTKTAALVRALKPARVAAFDMVFSEEEGREADSALSAAIRDAGNVVLGYFFRDDSTEEPGAAALMQMQGSRIGLVTYADEEAERASMDFPGLMHLGVETNTPLIGAGAAGFGSFNIIPHEDGIYRAATILVKYGPHLYPSLAAEALALYLGSDMAVHMASYGVDALTIGSRRVPLNEEGELTLNFYGPAASFKTYSAVDVMRGRVPADAFRDRLVFVGVTEKAIYDIRPTPVDAYYPGVELHATVAGNVLSGRYLIRDTRVVIGDLLMVLLVPLALAAMVSRVHRTSVSLAVFAALLALTIGGGFYLFVLFSIVPAIIYPALSLVLAYLSGEAYRNAVVEKKSRYLKKAFSTYVSPQLVAEILKDPERLKLGGEKRVVTVLFSDIRGFTTFSEKMPPEELVKLLNEYLSPMTRVVLYEGGMLDKYIGDAIMAVFNAPVETPGHPAKACNAALRMVEVLRRLNADWRGRGYPHVEIGIGINTGEAIVGNMGAELRFDYTAIGDTVNLASRLEGLNKVYGSGIIVSENTHALVKDSFVFRELDLVRVKGKERPIVIWGLVCAPDGAPGVAGLIQRHSEALSLYRQGRFEEARDVFDSMLAEHPDDATSALYGARCQDYIDTPPPPDWDGVFVAETK